MSDTIPPIDERPPFSHERLRVYHAAIDHLRVATAVAGAIAGRRRDLADQLLRAASSIVLNIAEGAAEVPPAEKRRFYRMARRSAAESAAIFDIIEVTRLGGAGRSREARGFLHAIVAMLTRMINGAATGRDEPPPDNRK
jgi:four helix bundle protein